MSVEPEQAQEEPPAAPGRRLRLSRTGWLVVAVAVLVAAGIVVLGARLADRDGGPAGGDRIATGPLAGREQAAFALVDEVASVEVRIADLGEQLYRVETPEGGRHLPEVTVDGDEVRLELADRAATGASSVTVRLSSAVRWRVRLLAGSTEQRVDLREAEVAGVELAGGAEQIELTLPPPQGTTTVRMSGGVAQWTVHQVGDAPVRLRAGAGAGTVSIDGEQTDGVGAGEVFEPPAWDGAEDRVDLEAAAGMAGFVLDRR